MVLLQSNPHEILGVNLGVWVTVIVTVVMFFVGARYTRYLDRRKERKNLQKVELYFKVLLGVLDKPMILQIEKLKEFNTTILERNQQHLILPKISSFNVNQLKAIRNQDLLVTILNLWKTISKLN